MSEWDEIEASWGEFVSDVRSKAGYEPDIFVGRVHRFYAGAMGSVELCCGETSGDLHWYEEYVGRDQLGDRFDELVAALRKCEARRVAEHEILMGTMARFYVSE